MGLAHGGVGQAFLPGSNGRALRVRLRIANWWASRLSKRRPMATMKHRMGDVEPRLVIANQPAPARRPAKRAFYHPSTGQDLEARLGIGPAYDLENEVPEAVPTLRNTPAREQRGS